MAKKKGMNPNSLKNLIPPKKGEIRNPKGRPKGQVNISTTLKKMLGSSLKTQNPLTGKESTQTLRMILTRKLMQMAIKGDLKSIKEIFDRVDGKAIQSIDMDIKGNIDSTTYNINIDSDFIPTDKDEKKADKE